MQNTYNENTVKFLLQTQHFFIGEKVAKNKVNKSILEKVLNIFSWLNFSLAIMIVLLSFFSAISSDKDGKEIFGYKMFIVASNSMSKSSASQNESVFFDSGDLIFVKTAKDNANYNVGDIITFISYNPESYGKTLTHKIRKVNYAKSGDLIGYTTYGINTGGNDKALVAPNTIIGEYSSKIPKLGNFFAYLKTPTGQRLSVIIPTTLLIIFFSINIGKYFGRKEASKDNVSTSEYTKLLEKVSELESKIKTEQDNENK